jgi:hypothetical protein
MHLTVIVTAALIAAGPPDGTLIVEASLPADSITAGGEYEIDLEVRLDDGWTASEAGLPKMFLQIDAPASVKLVGNELQGRELMRNGFVKEPWERLIDPGPATVRFRLDSAPKAGDRIGLNVVACLKADGRDGAWFVRRRVHLPLRPGAVAVPAAPTSSTWGDGSTVQIGEPAADFELPRADGSKVALSAFRGRTNVILTTYRAHW